jgi:riboflavin synthase
VFTGIIEEKGSVLAREGAKLTISARAVLEDSGLGASIAVNGCCLTLVEKGADWWIADVSDETYSRTNLGNLQPGDPVNLERPMVANGRFGGHIVLGHVDAVGEIVSPVPQLIVRVPEDLMRYIVEKGSCTVDGISLTVFNLTSDTFEVAVIPHTSEVTTLGHRKPGHKVNSIGGYGNLGFEIGCRNHGSIRETKQFMVCRNFKQGKMRQHFTLAKAVLFVKHATEENSGRLVALHQDIGLLFAYHAYCDLHGVGIHLLIDDLHVAHIQLQLCSNFLDFLLIAHEDRFNQSHPVNSTNRFKTVLVMCIRYRQPFLCGFSRQFIQLGKLRQTKTSLFTSCCSHKIVFIS